MHSFGRFFICFVLIGFASAKAFGFSQRYNLSLNTSYSTIVGSDSTYPKVFISTPLTPGLNFDFHYAEDSYFSSFIGLSYRSIRFLNDTKNNITVNNEGAQNDFGLKYYLYWNAFDNARMIFGVRYHNFYYFQSHPAGFVEVHSDFGAIGNLGLEYNFIKNGNITLSANGFIGFIGLSTGLKVNGGYSGEIESKLSYLYSKNLTLTGAFGYSEFHNNTSSTPQASETSQGLADLNLKLGLQKIF
jgi:hypothetical protein